MIESICKKNRDIELPVIENEIKKGGLCKEDIVSDKFYLSGYEVITFGEGSQFALETVLSSSVSYNDELLIFENGIDCLFVQELCERHQLSYSHLKGANGKDGFALLQDAIDNNSRISHVLMVIRDTDYLVHTDLVEMIHVCAVSGVDFILYYAGREDFDVSGFLNFGVSFIVFSPLSETEGSLVIAQRRSLVKTEGISSSFHYDLHRYWQKSLYIRGSNIEPMIV